MGIESLGWIIHEKACHLMRAFNERIEDQFQWVTEALAEAKKTLTDSTIQLIPKTPSEKKKRLRIWRRHGAGFGYRRFSNSRTSNFRGSYVSVQKSPPMNVSYDFSSAEISVCRTNLIDDFSETVPKSSSLLNQQQQPKKVVTMMTVAVQTDDVFIMQSIEPVCYLLGSGEPDICAENGCSKTVFCNETQSEKHSANSSVDLIEFLTSASKEKSRYGFYDQKGGDFSAEKLCHERNCLILDRSEIHNCLVPQLVDKILPPSTPDDCRRVAVLQTKLHKFEHNQQFQTIVLTFRKTLAASESGKGGSETGLIGETSEVLQQTSMSNEQPVSKAMSMNSAQEQRVEKENSTNKHLSSPNMKSAEEKQAEIKCSTWNNPRSPTKTFISLAPKILDLMISDSRMERFPIEPPSSIRRLSSNVSSLSSTGSRSLDSLDIQVTVDTDNERHSSERHSNERRSNEDNRDSVYCAVSYDSYELNANSVATVSTIGNFDVSGIPDDPNEPELNDGVCCNLSLSKICGTEIDTDDMLSDDEDVRDATKRQRKRRSKTPGRLYGVKRRPSCVVGARTSLSKRKSLVKASGGRQSLLKSRLAAAQLNSFAAVQPNAVRSTVASATTNIKRSSGYRIYKSARRRSSAIAARPALGACTAPSLRYQVQRTSARRDLLIDDGITTGKSGGIVTTGKGGGPRRSNAPVTPVAASKSRIQKLRKLFSPHSKSKTPAPNGAIPASTPRAAPTPPARRSKLQMWRGAELSQPSTLAPGSPSTGKMWLKASPFMHCFNAPRRSSVIENPRMKGKTTPGTNASASKSTNRFLKASQRPGTPSGDAEQSGTPRRGLFKRLQDKIKTPGKDSPCACLTPHPQRRPLGHCSEAKEVFGSLRPVNSNNFTAEIPHSLQVPSSSSAAVSTTSVQACVVNDVESVQNAGTMDRVKALREAELKVLLDVCSLDPSADEPLIIADSKDLSSYDITDLRPDSDDDSDDETSLPRGKSPVRMVPLWAEGRQLALAVVEHFYRSLDVEKLFGRILPPDLNEMFDKKKPRFDKRTSSANWEHPLDLRPFQP